MTAQPENRTEVYRETIHQSRTPASSPPAKRVLSRAVGVRVQFGEGDMSDGQILAALYWSASVMCVAGVATTTWWLSAIGICIGVYTIVQDSKF